MEVNHAVEVVNAIRTFTPHSQPVAPQATQETEAVKQSEDVQRKQPSAPRVEITADKRINIETRHARYRVDRKAGEIIAFIVDEKDEVVKQIPPEEMRRAAQQVDRLQGLLYDQLA